MFGSKRIKRTKDGDFRLRLPRAERELLRRLPAELRELLASGPADPDLHRLFPPAYEDDADEAEYRRLMHVDLVEGRRRSLRVLEESVDNERLSPGEAEAWLTALNDLRLVLGTRLDVSEDTLLFGLDLRKPRARQLALYAYLSGLQEELVAAFGT